jgi:hypothetical protein
MRLSPARSIPTVVICALLLPPAALAEVTKVTIASRVVVAGGQGFGSTGPYEKLTGTIDFSLDPTDRHNARIADLTHATRGDDGRVHFSADLYVLQPADVSRGNGALLFQIANRGRKDLLTRFNRAAASQDPTAAADFGDGFLMKEGYTLVWVGWQFDVAPPLLRVEAPAANVSGHVRVSFIPDEKRPDITPADLPQYLPVNPNDSAATLTVRDRFWDQPTTIARNAWQLTVASGRPRIVLESGFEPGRVYEVDYPATGARVAGVGLAAIRDAASAFLHRTDLPVRGRSAYVFGISQSGRFLRQFLHDGFNVDERDRRVFDAVWPHIAGAGQGSFNERFAMPGYSSFPATRFPYTDLEQRDARGEHDGILVAYRPEQLPKVIYTNTSVEYWGQGRAAALTHTTLDGKSDAALPDNVRIYLLSGTQHGGGGVPSVIRHRAGDGQPHATSQRHARAAAGHAPMGRRRYAPTRQPPSAAAWRHARPRDYSTFPDHSGCRRPAPYRGPRTDCQRSLLTNAVPGSAGGCRRQRARRYSRC